LAAIRLTDFSHPCRHKPLLRPRLIRLVSRPPHTPPGRVFGNGLSWSPKRRRESCALEALEAVATPSARSLLTSLASGASGASGADEAAAALARLNLP